MTVSESLSDAAAEAIMAVIARETDTFVARDFEGWAACWVQDGRTRLVSASVSFETRTLEQGPEGWRILHASFVLSGALEDAGRRIAVDGRGQVQSLSEAAREALAEHPGLTISHGRLRATRPAWDRVLQEGLARAAVLHGFCQHYRFMADHGRQFRLPLVLGETAEGGLAICMLFVRDGMTFVDLQPGGDFDARLELAKAVYGLSEGQIALARHVVAGQSLTAAAKVLGISVNTARTHLARIFDKTGVQSQTALVRTLLSIA